MVRRKASSRERGAVPQGAPLPLTPSSVLPVRLSPDLLASAPLKPSPPALAPEDFAFSENG